MAHVELCSVTTVVKDIRRGDVESALLMLLEPANPVATKEVDTGLVGENGPVANGPTRWDKFCDEYADVFEPPGFPAKRDIEHDIELLPGATP